MIEVSTQSVAERMTESHAEVRCDLIRNCNGREIVAAELRAVRL
jgi:hypothetical protein